VVSAGLEQLIEYIENMHFTKDDIEYLRGKGQFCEGFLQYLENFRFTGTIEALPEGTICYPNTPIVTVTAPVIEAQLIETILMVCMNHQSLVATKANRLVRAAKGTSVAEFGTRRAVGFDSAFYGSRAAYIGGCVGTSGVCQGRDFKIPLINAMIHSWVQMFDSEYEAFCEYAR
jgi:nicotinate phosphoribosyltransferase